MGRAKHILRLHPTAKPPDLIGHPVDAIEEERKVDLRYLDETEVRCPFEGSLFKTVKDLKVHIRDVHPEKVDLSCMACGVDCGSKEALLSHIQVFCTSSPQSPCPNIQHPYFRPQFLLVEVDFLIFFVLASQDWL